MSDYISGDRRRKGKDKMREKKKHPYRKGGKYRATGVKESQKDKC